jgi:hypothetical protein
VGLSSGSIAGGAFFGGFTGGFLASGGDFKTAILSGVGAMLTAGIGSMFGNVTFGESPLRFLQKAFTHGLVQGGLNSSLGGNFVDGLLGGFAGSAFEPFAGIVESASNSPILATITAAVVGGTVAAIGGGKFANGAASAAFVNLFNQRLHRGPAYSSNDLDPRIAAAGVGEIRMTPGDFQSIQAQHNIEYWNGLPGEKGMFNSDLAVNYEVFVSEIVSPALAPSTAPVTVIQSGRQGELFIDRALTRPIGIDRAGLPTTVVRIVVRYDWGLSLGSVASGGAGSVWQATGAYPISASQIGKR